MNNSEFSAIRNEITARIQLINSQENTAILMSIASWAAAAAIIINTINAPGLYLISLVLFYAPIILLIPISYKSGENLYQIEVLACYIKVFFEYKSLSTRETGEGVFAWELLNGHFSRMRSTNKWFLQLSNNSYTALAFLSLSAYFTDFIIILSKIETTPTITSFIAFIFFAFFVIGIIFLFNINRYSSVKINILDPEKRIVEYFVECAVTLDLIKLKNKNKMRKEEIEEIVRKITTYSIKDI